MHYDIMVEACLLYMSAIDGDLVCSSKIHGLETIIKYCLSKCLTIMEVTCCECGNLPLSIASFIVSKYKYLYC